MHCEDRENKERSGKREAGPDIPTHRLGWAGWAGLEEQARLPGAVLLVSDVVLDSEIPRQR